MNIPKTFVIGVNGFLGQAFLSKYRQIFPVTPGTSHHINSSFYLDLENPDLSSMHSVVKDYSYAIITASVTGLAKCEFNPAFTRKRNVEGIISLVKQLKRLGIVPIIFSTAYVFDGIEGNYVETSPTNPINEYGKQKVLLENLVPTITSDYLIIRCNKVLDLFNANTLLQQIYSSLQQKQEVLAAYDQLISPIYLNDLVNAVLLLQKNEARGIFHVSGKEILSRYDIAIQIANFYNFPTSLVKPISLDTYSFGFSIPKKTNLLCNKLNQLGTFQTTAISTLIQSLANSPNFLVT